VTDATQLDQAYQLILDDKHAEALAILRPIVKQDPDNADAWWLLSYAVDDPQEAHAALNKVATLSPDHAEAQQMLTTIHQEFPELAPQPSSVGGSDFESLGDLDFDSDPFADLDEKAPAASPVASQSTANTDEFFGDDPFAESEPGFVSATAAGETRPAQAEKPARRSPLPLILAIVVILVILLVGGFLIVPRFLNQPTETAVALNTPATLPAVVTSSVVTPLASENATQNVPVSLDTVTQAATSALIADGFSTPSVKVGTSLVAPKTLIATVCGKLGPDLQTRVNKAMDAMAAQASTISDQVGAAGVEVSSCGTSIKPLYRAYVSIADILTYVNGGQKDKRTFRESWKQ
jgi:hypothetical protein